MLLTFTGQSLNDLMQLSPHGIYNLLHYITESGPYGKGAKQSIMEQQIPPTALAGIFNGN